MLVVIIKIIKSYIILCAKIIISKLRMNILLHSYFVADKYGRLINRI